MDVAFEQAGPASEFLADCEGHCVLQVGAADLDDAVELLRFGCDGMVHGLDRGDERILHAIGRCDVHGRGERVVGRLRHVDVIIWMNWFLGPHFAAGDFDGAVGDHFVHVHVGLGAAAGLPDAQGELVVEFAGDDFVGRLHDESRYVRGKLAQILIHQGAGFLERAKGADQLRRHGVASDVEVQQRTLGLRAPVDVRGDFDLSHAVGLDAGLYFGCGGGFGKSRHDGSCLAGRSVISGALRRL